SPARSFTRLRLHATRSHPLALGALVRLSAGGVVRQDYVRITDGFLSQVPADLHFGLGDARTIDWIEVRWPSGGPVQRFENVPAGRLVLLTEGEAVARLEDLPAWPAGSAPVATRGAAPDVELPAVDGPARPVAAKDRPAVLNFWSPSCAPCLEEIPA